MNNRKQKQLFDAARANVAVEPSHGFVHQVLRAMERPAHFPMASTWQDQLNAMFPRIAVAALIVIFSAGALEFWAGSDLTAQALDASEQLLLPLDWL